MIANLFVADSSNWLKNEFWIQKKQYISSLCIRKQIWENIKNGLLKWTNYVNSETMD